MTTSSSSSKSLKKDFAGRQLRNAIAYGITLVVTLLALALLAYLLIYLLIHGTGAINWDFVTKEPTALGEEGGGIAPSLVGTGTLVLLSMIVGVPFGIGFGIYLSEYATNSWFSRMARIAINTFIGVPSIIAGIFVYFVLVKPMGNFSAIAGGAALGIIMIPILARTAEDVLQLVPNSIREAGLALGVPRWRVILTLVIPAARGGLITGGVLAIARVAGETAPLILTALGNEFFAGSLFEPIDEITLRILKYARGPYDIWHEQAYGAALLLVVGVALGSLLLRLTTRGQRIKAQ
ncbi:MAG: phosphate ABC transporter, permease protein PstA [Chloroflexi bacterium 54-19]|nr:MAG: phosphate ABC transporter, permease protein PstA [Chloroflexi bacterium 54-19]